MPRPCGIVHLEVDGDELLHRLKSRGRVTVRHEGLSEDALFADILFAIRVANLAKTVLESRGVPVLNLDGADDLEENAKIIIDFFKKV